MRVATVEIDGQHGLAAAGPDNIFRGLLSHEPGYPGSLDAIIRGGGFRLDQAADSLSSGSVIDLDKVKLLPPLTAPGKVILALRFSFDFDGD